LKFMTTKDHDNDIKELIKQQYDFFKTAKVR
jgi:hypothetical protein